jgi:hypothetical protein
LENITSWKTSWTTSRLVSRKVTTTTFTRPTAESFGPEARKLSILSVVVCGSKVEAAEKFQKLNGAHIQAKFAGMELTDESHWGDVFERNGTLATSSMGHKSIGKWRVQKDQRCLDRGKEPGGRCYEVWLSGAKVELRSGPANLPLEGVLQKPMDRR